MTYPTPYPPAAPAAGPVPASSPAVPRWVWVAIVPMVLLAILGTVLTVADTVADNLTTRPAPAATAPAPVAPPVVDTDPTLADFPDGEVRAALTAWAATPDRTRTNLCDLAGQGIDAWQVMAVAADIPADSADLLYAVAVDQC